MVRVLALTNMYPPHHLGGYELECQDVLEGFRARGHECLLLTSTVRVPGVDDPPGEREAGTRRDLQIYWDDYELLKPSIADRLRRERHNQAVLRQALDELRPDVISIWHMGAMSLGLLSTLATTGIPMVYVVCDTWLSYAWRHDRWTRMFRRAPRVVRDALERLTGVPCSVPELGPTGAFCFVSEKIRRSAGGVDAFPMSSVVYSGIESGAFAPRPASAGPFKWRLLYLGRVDATKGVDTVINALADLPEAELHIVGRGADAELERLRTLARTVGVDDRVCWSVAERHELARTYWGADVLVFPVTWEEPFGLVPLEAMACGTPVLATATGGSAEFLIDGWNCLRFAPNDAAALASAARRLAADPALRHRLATNGYATAAALSVQRLVDTLEAWHMYAASGFRGDRPPDRRAIDASLTAEGSDPDHRGAG